MCYCRIFPAATLCAVAASAPLFSASYSRSAPVEQPPIAQTNIRHEWQPISASALIDKGWVVDATLLYWNAKVDGYQFAEKIKLKGLSTGGLPTQVNATAVAEMPSFNTWDPGVQVSIGYVFPQREQWQLQLSWEYFNTSNHKSVKTPTEEVGTKSVLPTLFPLLIGTLADRAHAHWRMHYNVWDLELNRQFFLGKWLSLKPKIGVRGAWIKQHFKTDYHAFFSTSAGLFDFDTFFSCKQDFGAVGLKLGNDAQFYISPSWSILGNFSTSLLWGSFHLKEQAAGRIFVSATDSFPEVAQLSNKASKLRAMLEGQLGMQWQTYWSKGKYRFAISALYSLAYWFKQNMLINQIIGSPPNLQQPSIVDSTVNGDLQLQGVNVQFEFDF